MIVRPLTRRDLDDVARIDALHTGSRKRRYWRRVFDEFLGSPARRDRVGLGAEVGRRLAGYLLAEVRAFEFGSPPCGWVFAVGVDPGQLRRGLASALLEEACRRFRRAKVSEVRTMVRRTDIPVLSFFRASGFIGGPFVQLERDLERGRSDRPRAVGGRGRPGGGSMSSDDGTPRLGVETLEGGALRRFVLTGSKGNVIDTAMSRALTEAFREAALARDLKAILLEGDGPNFSYGASVQEHLPDRVAAMLRGFHGLFRALMAGAVPVLCAVRGRCLGGGLELAAFCNRIFAAPDAILGQPEIVLGVFPPIASLFLRERVGRGAAEDLVLSGRTIGAGRVTEVIE